MHLFYQPELAQGLHQLNEEESGHALRVLRLSIGSQAEVTDGKGTRALIELTGNDKRGCSFRIISQTEQPRPLLPNVAMAPTKNLDRFEWFLEKAVEIGVGSIYPILCSNSERRVLKTDRCEKVMLAAMKQSQRDHLPVILPLTPFKDFLKLAEGQLLMAHCRDGEKQPLQSLFPKESWILIGPEGDFSVEEIAAATAKGAIGIDLGKSRLRTETAGIFALSVMNYLK